MFLFLVIFWRGVYYKGFKYEHCYVHCTFKMYFFLSSPVSKRLTKVPKMKLFHSSYILAEISVIYIHKTEVWYLFYSWHIFHHYWSFSKI